MVSGFLLLMIGRLFWKVSLVIVLFVLRGGCLVDSVGFCVMSCDVKSSVSRLDVRME